MHLPTKAQISLVEIHGARFRGTNQVGVKAGLRKHQGLAVDRNVKVFEKAGQVAHTLAILKCRFAPVELFRDVLEEQLQRHADQLSELISCTRQPDRRGYDEEILIARTVSSRRALADTAAALRRMAEDTYGTCKRCAGSIPLERLNAVPQTPFCLPCQQARTG